MGVRTVHRNERLRPKRQPAGAPWIAVILLGFAGLTAGCGESDGDGVTPLSEVDGMAYGVSQILFPVGKGGSQALAESLIRQAYKAIESGKDFATVARARSKGAAASDGGFLGFVPTAVDTAFAGAVQCLRPGDISPPVRTSLGWHILKRHSFEETRELEQRYSIPTHGVFIGWDDPSRANQGAATGRTHEQAHQLALELRERLANGQTTLNDAMQLYMATQSQRPGAYLGTTSNREKTRGMFKALQGAKPGQILGPLDTPAGVAIFLRGRYLRSLFRHILVQHVKSKERPLSVSRTRDAARARAEAALKEVLADRGHWEEAVGRYSDDPYSRPVGGRMGVLHNADMPPGFEGFAFDLEPDTILPQVVETEYGFHVVWKVN
jgi:parvulin-like peptidyl-prolyl isomerase